MKTSRAWIIYAAIRLLAFAVPFVLVMLLFPGWQLNWLIGIVVGSITGFTVSIIFLRNERLAIGSSIMAAREGRAPKGNDAAAEDALLDGDADAEPTDDGADDR